MSEALKRPKSIDDDDSESVTVAVGESEGIDEVVIAFRKDGQLREFTSLTPPLEATLRQL